MRVNSPLQLGLLDLSPLVALILFLLKITHRQFLINRNLSRPPGETLIERSGSIDTEVILPRRHVGCIAAEKTLFDRLVRAREAISLLLPVKRLNQSVQQFLGI